MVQDQKQSGELRDEAEKMGGVLGFGVLVAQLLGCSVVITLGAGTIFFGDLCE